MTFKPARLLLALLAVAAAPTFAQNLAVVNGKAIPSSRADAVVKQVVAQGQQADTPQLRDAIKKDLIAREVLMQEAEKQNFGKSADVKSALDNARQTIVINALVRDYLGKHKITDEEIKAEYDRYKAQMGDKEYHVRHILLENEADAKAVIAKIKAGAKFEDLAKEKSKDPGTAANGGDLDWASPSSFPKNFADAFVGLQKGMVTENPVQTPAGFHVVKLDDVRPAKLPSLDEVKPQVADALAQKKLQAYQEELVKKAGAPKPVAPARIDQIVKQEVAQGKAADTPELREQIKKALSNRDVLVAEADKLGLGMQADVKTALENARQSIVINALRADWLKKHPIADADAKAEYDKFKAQMGDKEYHARHILVPTEAEAKDIIAKLKAGAKFEDLAKEKSKDGSAANGGDLDWASPANYVKEFSDAMVALQKGQITETPVKSQYGYHVIKLEDVRDAKLPSFDEVKPRVVESMQQRRLAEFTEGLIAKAKIDYNLTPAAAKAKK